MSEPRVAKCRSCGEDTSERCTVRTATQCPLCGRCACETAPGGKKVKRDGCPLHSDDSEHGSEDRPVVAADNLAYIAERIEAIVYGYDWRLVPPPKVRMHLSDNAEMVRAVADLEGYEHGVARYTGSSGGYNVRDLARPRLGYRGRMIYEAYGPLRPSEEPLEDRLERENAELRAEVARLKRMEAAL